MFDIFAHTRKRFMELNARMTLMATRIRTPVDTIELIYVGAEPNDGTGDTIQEGIRKVLDNAFTLIDDLQIRVEELEERMRHVE